MDDLQLPNTDSPEVMQQAISLHVTGMIWDHAFRTVDPDEMEQAFLDLYKRVYASVSAARRDA